MGASVDEVLKTAFRRVFYNLVRLHYER